MMIWMMDWMIDMMIDWMMLMLIGWWWRRNWNDDDGDDDNDSFTVTFGTLLLKNYRILVLFRQHKNIAVKFIKDSRLLMVTLIRIHWYSILELFISNCSIHPTVHCSICGVRFGALIPILQCIWMFNTNWKCRNCANCEFFWHYVLCRIDQLHCSMDGMGRGWNKLTDWN